MVRSTSMHKNTRKMEDNDPGTAEAFNQAVRPEESSDTRRLSDEATVSRGSMNGEGRDKQENDQRSRIAERAFMLYEESGFRHGNDVEHWLEAERHVNTLGV